MDRFFGKNVLVFGLGINQGGLGVARFFVLSGAKVRVTDLKTSEQLKSSIDQLQEFPAIEYVLGEHRNEDIEWADLIIKNPGVKPGNQYIEYAKSLGKQIEMEMGIFIQLVKPGQIIGVTGTKGKSTTSSLIYEELKASGKDVVFAGNIGKSVLDTVESIGQNTIVVLEISSFQLEAFEQYKVSPHRSVITNITPDHLNYYGSMEEYIKSKRPVGLYQSQNDFLFLRKDDQVATKKSFLEDFRGQVIYFSPSDLPSNFSPKLLGEHNRFNIAAALSVSKTLGLDQDNTLQALANFGGVEFRQQLVKEIDGIKIYNDTSATGPDAGIKALQTFPNAIMIVGGVDKNLPYQEYALELEESAKRVFFLEGDATEKIKKNMKNLDKVSGTYNNLVTLLSDVKKIASSGDVIVFSPAAASFNLFQNEFDRGRKFNEAVDKIFI